MAWASNKERWGLAGVFGGLALTGRLHAAVIVAVLGLALAVRRRDPAIAVRMGTASGAFVVAVSAWDRWVYGTWNPTASYDASRFFTYAEMNRIDLANQLGFWISPDRGILVWTPLILLLIPALARSWADLPDWSRALLAGGILYTLLQGTLTEFSGGDVFYGYRFGLELLVAASPALALSTPAMGRIARTVFVPLITLQFVAIMVGAISDTIFLPGSAAWTDNAFLAAVRLQPLGFLALILVIQLVTIVASRIYANPNIERRRG